MNKKFNFLVIIFSFLIIINLFSGCSQEKNSTNENKSNITKKNVSEITNENKQDSEKTSTIDTTSEYKETATATITIPVSKTTSVITTHVPISTKKAVTKVPTSAPVIASTTSNQIEKQSRTVYITNTGSKYHRDGCRYLRQSKIPISIDEAVKNYTPCSICNP
jgi:hypothetical protein